MFSFGVGVLHSKSALRLPFLVLCLKPLHSKATRQLCPLLADSETAGNWSSLHCACALRITLGPSYPQVLRWGFSQRGVKVLLDLKACIYTEFVLVVLKHDSETIIYMVLASYYGRML